MADLERNVDTTLKQRISTFHDKPDHFCSFKAVPPFAQKLDLLSPTVFFFFVGMLFAEFRGVVNCIIFDSYIKTFWLNVLGLYERTSVSK